MVYDVKLFRIGNSRHSCGRMSIQADGHGQSSELPLQARGRGGEGGRKRGWGRGGGKLQTLGACCNFNMVPYIQPKELPAQDPLMVPGHQDWQHSIFCFYLHPHQASLRNSSSSFPLSSAALGPLHRSVVSPCLSRTTNRVHCTHLHIGSCLQERLFSE